jgi:hypothetical protein
MVVDDERTPIRIKDAEGAGRQSDPTGLCEQDALSPVHIDVDEVSGVERVVPACLVMGISLVDGGVARLR